MFEQKEVYKGASYTVADLFDKEKQVKYIEAIKLKEGNVLKDLSMIVCKEAEKRVSGERSMLVEAYNELYKILSDVDLLEEKEYFFPDILADVDALVKTTKEKLKKEKEGDKVDFSDEKADILSILIRMDVAFNFSKEENKFYKERNDAVLKQFSSLDNSYVYESFAKTVDSIYKLNVIKKNPVTKKEIYPDWVLDIDAVFDNFVNTLKNNEEYEKDFLKWNF